MSTKVNITAPWSHPGPLDLEQLCFTLPGDFRDTYTFGASVAVKALQILLNTKSSGSGE